MKPKSETVQFSNGKISTRIPRFELTPLAALEALALRHERGVRLKGDGAWNALTNQDAVDDKQFVIDRLAHCIHHCYKAIDAIAHDEPLGELEDGGDAGAIMFGGALLACYAKRLK